MHVLMLYKYFRDRYRAIPSKEIKVFKQQRSEEDRFVPGDRVVFPGLSDCCDNCIMLAELFCSRSQHNSRAEGSRVELSAQTSTVLRHTHTPSYDTYLYHST